MYDVYHALHARYDCISIIIQNLKEKKQNIFLYLRLLMFIVTFSKYDMFRTFLKTYLSIAFIIQSII